MTTVRDAREAAWRATLRLSVGRLLVGLVALLALGMARPTAMVLPTPELTGTPGAPSTPTPIWLDSGPQLFIDDYMVESSQNVARRVNSPQRQLTQSVVSSREGYRAWQPWISVLRETTPVGSLFRMWYNASNPGADGVDETALGYLESEDGIVWEGPHRLLKSAPVSFGASILDEGPDFPEPAERYKLAYYTYAGPYGPAAPGMNVAFSPDGLEWHPYGGNPALTDLTPEDDIFNVFYDSFGEQYGLILKLWGTHSWTDAEGRDHSGYIRLVGISRSADFRTWDKPILLFTPDSGDSGRTQFYGAGGFLRRGDIMIGMLKELRDDLTVSGAPPEASGYGYTVLIWSRDGVTWERDRYPDVFLAPDPTVGAWDHAHAWIDSTVEVEDEVYLYYGGYRWGHKYEPQADRQIGLVRLQRDRFVAREAGEAEGTLITPLLAFETERMWLNVDAAGGIAQVQILDRHGNPLPGFTFADCQPITEDALDAPLNCRRLLGELTGMPVHIEFSLINARLFAFTFE